MREALGMQSAATYIFRSQVTLAQWVVLNPIFDVCTREHVYYRRGCRRDPQWQHEAPYETLREPWILSLMRPG